MREKELLEAAQTIGLNDMEARIYVFLLKESPATGYRIARAIGKAAANTYQTLESMERKGLILVEEGEPRLCRAVPYQEMLGRLERQFQENSQQAAKVFSAIESIDRDERVYPIRSRNQLIGRFRAMLERAEQLAVIDAFPIILAELKADIESAASRGVKITVKTYEPMEFQGAKTVVDHRGTDPVVEWPGLWLNLVIDAGEHLLAFLTKDGEGVHLAVWSGSPYLSWIYFGGISSEILVDEIHNTLAQGGDLESIRLLLEEYHPGDEDRPLGRKVLMERFGMERYAGIHGRS